MSTIIPVYNRPKMLLEAVQSVLGQTYRPIEIIIVDDGSTDETFSVASRFAIDLPDIVRVVQKENSGAGPSREAGRQRAQGEFIQYLDSDDLLLPDKFRLQVEALRQAPDCGAAYGWISLQREDGSRLPAPYKCSGEERPTLFPWLLADRWWNTDAPLWRRSVCDAIGPWSDLRWSQDWEYDARAAARRVRLAYVPEYVTIQRQHAGVRQTSEADWERPERVKNRRTFFEMMLNHALQAEIPPSDIHRQHFTRWIFATARVAARAGLSDDADALMRTAVRSAGGYAASTGGFRSFTTTAKLLGWPIAGRLFCVMARLKRPSALTLPESFSRTPNPCELGR